MTPPEPMTEDKLRMLWLFARADEKRGYLWLGDAVREIDRLRAENAILGTRLEEAHDVFMRMRRTGCEWHGSYTGEITPCCLHHRARSLPQPPKGSDDGEQETK